MDWQYNGGAYPFKVQIKDVQELLTNFTLEEIGTVKLETIVDFSRLALSRAKKLPLDIFRANTTDKEWLRMLLNKNFLESKYYEGELL